MRKKIFVLFIGSILLAASLGIGFLVTANNDESIDLQPIDVGPKIRSSDYPITNMEQYQHQYEEKTGKSDIVVGSLLDWAILDDYNGTYHWTEYELRALGEQCEIWVQTDLSYPEEQNRPDPIVTDDQITYLLGEFEDNIYPMDTSYFGEPDFLDGSTASEGKDWEEETGRSVILVSNVRDEAYYFPDYPYYIAGFYSPTFEGFFGRNIITIDSYNWEDRVGPDVARPYLYEAIIAHEYQHLIHDDWNTDDPSFMNEGCSMYAEPLCGYPLAWGDIDSYLFTPDNSLTDWGDQGDINILADYGCSLMWAVYLGDHFGAEFLSHFVKSGIPGIEGINSALIEFGFEDTFDDVFHDWRIANLIHTGDYDYNLMDIGIRDPTRVYVLDSTDEFPFYGVDFGITDTILGYSTGISKLGSYSSDYIKLEGLSDTEFQFDGDDFGTAASWEIIDGTTLYSTPAWSECDLSIIVDLDLSSLDEAILSFETKYQIEVDWDFGFVQVSTDGGLTWTSIENDYTTATHNANAYPAIVENLPGLSGEMDWTNMEFDLSDYVGQEIMLQFRYMTDWAYEEAGWWISDIKINDDSILVDDFYLPPPPETDFLVTLIGENGLIVELELDTINEYGTLNLWEYFSEDEYIYLVISTTKGQVDYSLRFLEAMPM